MKLLVSFALAACALLAQTATYPAAIPTDADLLVQFDRASTRLSVGITADTLTIPVENGGVFPLAAGQATIVTIENEQIKICSRSGNTLTACDGGRGFAGTTAVSHASTRDVRGLNGAWYHNRLKAEVKAIAEDLGANMRTAARYHFAPIAPGGALTAGLVNVVTFSSSPQGVAGSNTGHLLYISGGAGTAEAVTITGGTCTSGATTTCTLTFTPAYTHTGAWTIASATGGIQEGVCALPSAGGQIDVTADVTLYADVSECGKASVRVARLPNVAILGAHKILTGSYASRAKHQVFHSAPAYSSLTRLHDGTRYDIGGFPEAREFGFDGSPAVQSLVGTINVPDDGAINPLFAAGVAGYGRAERQGADAVGVYGGGECAGALTQCWGGNLTVQNGNMTIGGSNLVGLEVDSNNSASGANAPAIIQGITSIGNFPANASGYKHAYTSQVVNTYAWDISYISRDGASGVAFQAGTVAEGTSPSNSQISQWASRSPAGVTRTAYQFNDSDGVFWVRGTTGGNIAFDVSGTASASMLIHPHYVIMGRPLRLYSGTLAVIGSGPLLSDGDMVYCTDCQVTSGTNNTCAVGGTGALAVQVNGALRCFNAQN